MKYRIVKHWGDDGFYVQKRVLFWWRPATREVFPSFQEATAALYRLNNGGGIAYLKEALSRHDELPDGLTPEPLDPSIACSSIRYTNNEDGTIDTSFFNTDLGEPFSDDHYYKCKLVLGKPQEHGGTYEDLGIRWSMWWSEQKECWAGTLDTIVGPIYDDDFDELKKDLYELAKSHDHQ